MNRDIKFDMSSPSGVNFKGAKYVIYFNPLLFLKLDIKQMETTIKHEILHVISLHLVRAKELKDTGKYSTLAINLAMDVVVNQYLNYLPPFSATLEWVNVNYNLKLEPYQTFEYYLKKIQIELDLQEEISFEIICNFYFNILIFTFNPNLCSIFNKFDSFIVKFVFLFIKNSYEDIYKIAIENEEFVDLYFQSYSLIRG